MVPPRGLDPWLLTAAPFGAGSISRHRASQGLAPLAIDCRPVRGWLDLSSSRLPGVCTPGYRLPPRSGLCGQTKTRPLNPGGALVHSQGCKPLEIADGSASVDVNPGGVTEARPQPSALPTVALSELVPYLVIVPPRGLHPWLLTAAPIRAGCISRHRACQGFAPLAMDFRPDRGWLDLSSSCLPGVCTPGYGLPPRSGLVGSLVNVPPRGLHPWLLTAAPFGVLRTNRYRVHEPQRGASP